MLRQAAHQRLHRLILHQRDADQPRVLQARGKKVDTARRAIPKLHLHLPEVVLAEFAGQTLKTHLGLDLLRPQRGHQAVQRALAPRVARPPDSPQDLHRRQAGLLFQDLDDQFPEILHPARPANPPVRPLSGIIDVHNGSFHRDPFDGAQGNSRQPRHLDLRVTSLQQDFDLVSLQHPQHPPPSAPPTTSNNQAEQRKVSNLSGSCRTAQNFWNLGGQNFWN